MNILIPICLEQVMEFFDTGYKDQLLIDIEGKPMIQRVVENLNIDGNFIFLVRTEHLKQYPYLSEKLLSIQASRIVKR